YFTQVICFALFGQARERENWKVTGEDVQNVLEKAIEHAEGGLAWFWDGLPIPEQAIFSAVAEAQRRVRERNELVPQNPLMLLKEYGVLLTKELEQALKQLIEKGFLDDAGRKVKVELVRRWLLKRHSLRQEIFVLEKLNSEADRIYEVAATLHQQDKKPQALKLYEQALALNPNHFSALLDLAEGYLDNKDFGKAVAVYTRGDKIDPIRTQQGFVRSLLSYGNELWSKQKQEKWELAKKQFTKVQEIEPDNAPAQEKLLEIQAFENQKNRHSENNWRFLSRTLIVAAVVGIPVLIGIGFWLRLNYCPPGQTRVDGICKPAKPLLTLPPQPFRIPKWEPQRFSRGERTLFPSKNNPDRDRGIEAFKQGNYLEAAELFAKAVTANSYTFCAYREGATTNLHKRSPTRSGIC
ncbi:MAG: tetratricopeptide repeat protein, partial [Xenococcaceae cyanobacterium]